MSGSPHRMDDEALASSCNEIARQLAWKRLGEEPRDTIKLDMPEEDHVARLWLYPRDGVEPHAYRQVGFDMRRPLDAIRRMTAAYAAFHGIGARADAWNALMTRHHIAHENAPAWALYVPPGIRPLMQPDARDAYDRWVAGGDMGDAFEGTGVEVLANGADLLLHSAEQTGLRIELGRVVYTVDPLPSSITALLPGRPLADLIGGTPHGIELDHRHVIHTIMQTASHELEIYCDTGPWSQGAPTLQGGFALPGPRTIGMRPGRTDSGWGYG